LATFRSVDEDVDAAVLIDRLANEALRASGVDQIDLERGDSIDADERVDGA
jgi:hypothetical protein